MTGCCRAADFHFDASKAARELASYRRRGPTGTARLLLDLLGAVRARPATLLDVGAGIGVLHHELLERGVATACHVEGASAYIAAAQAEADRRGHAGRVAFLHGDAVELARELQPMDLVTLDRVVCCYPDCESLLHATVPLARRYYALSLPHDRWYMRAYTAWENRRRDRTGNPFRTFIHPPGRIRALLEEAGCRLLGRRLSLAWDVRLYERPDPA